jgi:hypothetical protein
MAHPGEGTRFGAGVGTGRCQSGLSMPVVLASAGILIAQ